MKGKLRLSYVLTLCLAFMLAAVAVSFLASAATIEEWTARYNGPGNGEDDARAIAIDTLGNVYVTGEGEGDYATVKYDTNGNELWEARYNGPGSGWDSASAIAVDTSGNVYVTGQSDGDYATVKYDTDGNELWEARYNGPGNGGDSASAIAIDALGNVYVTGDSRDNELNYDYATVKYDTAGNELWVARYNGPTNGDDFAKAIAVDGEGNIYITGGSDCDGTYRDYATVKYDPDGNELWVKRYDGPTNDYDLARAIAVDGSGSVYVTGFSTYRYSCGGICYDDDYATVKYDTNGNELWVQRYNSPGSGEDRATDLAIDASGNVYVTGTIGAWYDYDYTTVKYDTDGHQLWVRQYNSPGDSYDDARAIAIDALGNIYVTGESEGDYATVKYDTNGNQLWGKRYNGPGSGDDSAIAIAIDGSGSVYVTGRSEGSETYADYATVKYDSNGNELWEAGYNSPGSGDDVASAIAVDGSGNVYVTGESAGTGTYADYATVKYDSNGNQLWEARYNGPGSGDDRAKAIAVDGSGNVYVTGESAGTGTYADYATVKYDSNGNEIWVQRYNGPGDGGDRASAIAVDGSGNIYVTGGSEGDYVTVKYDTAGNQLWEARYNGPGNGDDFAKAIAVDGSGNIYITGESEGDGTYRDYATVKYDPNGNQLWEARYNGPGDGYENVTAMAVDPSGNVYVTGGSDSDYATVKYDTAGNQLWEARYNGPGNGRSRACAIAVDGSGNVYVTGGSYGIGENIDYATVKYDTDGNELWVKRYNGPENGADSASTIAVDGSGNVYVTGESDFRPYPPYAYSDYATVKYDTNGNELWVKRYNGPANGDDRAYAMAVDTSGNVYVTGKSRGSGPYDDYATVKYGQVDEVEITMDLSTGWSMISLPVKPEVATVTALFPDAVVMYRYQKGVGYVRVTGGENLEVGVGYWILLNSPQLYVITGTAITEYTNPVADGWYMIGGCSMPADKMVTSGKIDVIYGYTQGKGYTRVPGSQPLERGKGYWILFSNTSQGAEFTASISISE